MGFYEIYYGSLALICVIICAGALYAALRISRSAGYDPLNDVLPWRKSK